MKNRLDCGLNVKAVAIYCAHKFVFARVSVSTLVLSLAACGGQPKEIHELTKMRVPVAQFYAETTDQEAEKKVGCTKLSAEANAKTYCQQFPLRFGKTFKLRFIAISPEGTAASLSVTKLKKILAVTQASAFASGGATKDTPLSDLQIAKDASLSRVLQEKPMRIEQIVYTLVTPSLDKALTESGSLPAYEVSYEGKATAKNPADSNSEQGYYSFYVLPDSSDTETWDQLKTRAAQAGLPNAVLEAAKARAVSNVPPRITSLLPKSGQKAASGTFLEINLAQTDKDPGAKTRIQWYTTTGKLGNQRARRTSWDVKSGPAGAFVVVRDLQGGLDFSYSTLK